MDFSSLEKIGIGTSCILMTRDGDKIIEVGVHDPEEIKKLGDRDYYTSPKGMSMGYIEFKDDKSYILDKCKSLQFSLKRDWEYRPYEINLETLKLYYIERPTIPGVTLRNYLEHFREDSLNDVLIRINVVDELRKEIMKYDEWMNLIEAFIQLNENILLDLNDKQNIYHCNLSENTIFYNKDDNKMYIVDFFSMNTCKQSEDEISLLQVFCDILKRGLPNTNIFDFLDNNEIIYNEYNKLLNIDSLENINDNEREQINNDRIISFNKLKNSIKRLKSKKLKRQRSDEFSEK